MAVRAWGLALQLIYCSLAVRACGPVVQLNFFVLTSCFSLLLSSYCLLSVLACCVSAIAWQCTVSSACLFSYCLFSVLSCPCLQWTVFLVGAVWAPFLFVCLVLLVRASGRARLSSFILSLLSFLGTLMMVASGWPHVESLHSPPARWPGGSVCVCSLVVVLSPSSVSRRLVCCSACPGAPVCVGVWSRRPCLAFPFGLFPAACSQ